MLVAVCEALAVTPRAKSWAVEQDRMYRVRRGELQNRNTDCADASALVQILGQTVRRRKKSESSN